MSVVHRVAGLAAAGMLVFFAPVPARAQSAGEPAQRAAEAVESTPRPEAAAMAVAPASPPLPSIVDRVPAAAGGAAADDIAALRTFYAETGNTPLWFADGTMTARARAVMDEIGRADDWGLTASAFTLPAAPAAGDTDAALRAEAQLSLAVLTYARHARGGRFDPSKISEDLDRTPNLIAPAAVLAGIAAAAQPDAFLRKLHPQHPQFEKLRQLYLKARAGTLEPQHTAAIAETPEPQPEGKRKRRKAAAPKPAAPPALTADRLLVNMEQWRWMPDDLGRLHVVANIPEFQMRVMKDGRELFSERVIVGRPNAPTPIFSKDMSVVVFQPGWGVPPSIKVKELLPGLLAGRDPVSARGLVVRHRGREVSPHSIDWRSVDIRRVSIVQPPGPGNALGQVKFLFPNRHDVYMHDTPTKGLFNASVRAFSAGCVRVRNPMRFAEILFAETGGWSAQRVAGLARARPDHEVSVPGHVEVHLTYFTVVVDDDGKAHTFRDIYGHEPRIRAGIDGRATVVARRSEDLANLRRQLVERSGPVRMVRASYEAEGDQRRRGRSAREPRRTSGARPASGGSGWFSLF